MKKYQNPNSVTWHWSAKEHKSYKMHQMITLSIHAPKDTEIIIKKHLLNTKHKNAQRTLVLADNNKNKLK